MSDVTDEYGLGDGIKCSVTDGGTAEVISVVSGTSMNNATPGPCSSADITTTNSSIAKKVKKAKFTNQTVYFDQFLEVKCAYLCPNNLDDTYMSKDNSEFVVVS